MKVLVLPSWHPTEENLISGSFFMEQARALYQSGVDISLIQLDVISLRRLFKNKQRLGFFRDKNADFPVYVYRQYNLFPFIKGGYIKQKRRMAERAYKKIAREQGQFDLLHLHSFMEKDAAIHLCDRFGLKLVYTEHLSKFVTGKYSSQDLEGLMQTMQKASVSIAVGYTLQKVMKQYGDTLCIPNLVDTEIFKPSHTKKERDEFVFGCMGGLKPMKRFGDAIKAFAAAFQNDASVKLHIAGDGAEREKLEKSVAELGISERVKFFGRITRDEAQKFMQDIDYLIITSEAETFGVVAVEALATGKPVISSECGGPEAIINDFNGILYNTGDINALAGAMIYVKENKEQYDPQAIRKDCIERFGTQAVCSEITEVYKKVYND